MEILDSNRSRSYGTIALDIMYNIYIWMYPIQIYKYLNMLERLNKSKFI
jgi:hypothetical protein